MDMSPRWAAPFFEGEGCFSFNVVRGRRYPQAMLKHTDYASLTRFHKSVGVGKIYDVKAVKKKNGEPARRAWNWKCSGEDAGKVAAMLLDELTPGSEKLEDAHMILDVLDLCTHVCTVCGEFYRPKNVRSRFCGKPECRREARNEDKRRRYRELRDEGLSREEAAQQRYWAKGREPSSSGSAQLSLL